MNFDKDETLARLIRKLDPPVTPPSEGREAAKAQFLAAFDGRFGRRMAWPRWVAAAAAAALLALGFYGVVRARQGNGGPSVTERPAPIDPQPAPSIPENPAVPGPVPAEGDGGYLVAYAPLQAMDPADFMVGSSAAGIPIRDEPDPAAEVQPRHVRARGEGGVRRKEPEPPVERESIRRPELAPDADAPLVVHEWGVIGLDAHGLYDPAVALAADLPDYIKKAKPVAPAAPRPINVRKPILYVYPSKGSLTRLHLTAGASFSKGKPLYFWPPAHVQNNLVQWSGVTLAPVSPGGPGGKAKERPVAAPRSVPKGHWVETARDTDAVWLWFNGETERFLFYDGETAFVCPFTMKAEGEGVAVSNAGKSPARDIFLIERKEKTIRIGYAKALDGGKTATLKGEETPAKGKGSAAEKLEEALVAAGLFEKEAAGMTKIWKEDFFDRPGRWLLWRVDPEAVDRMIPLSIQPKPEKVVRVMLVVAPVATTLEKRVAELVPALGDADFGKREAAQKAILDLGPFAAAYLLAHERHADLEIRQRVGELLDKLGRPE